MLSEQRRKIDQLDQQIVSLVEERMAVVSEVARIKAVNDVPVLDSQREEAVLVKIRSYVTDKSYEESIAKLYEEMMAISRAYQKAQSL